MVLRTDYKSIVEETWIKDNVVWQRHELVIHAL